MRVSQSMLTNNMLRNLSNSYSSLGKYMDQLSTGKKVNKPSDDPVVAMKGMDYRSQVTEVEQYQRNISEVHNWMDNSDSALDKATQALHRMRELAVQGSNDTYEKGQRKNIAAEVDQLKEHLIDIANTEVNGKYLFNGTGTTGALNTEGKSVPPVTTNANGEVTSVSTNTEAVLIEVLGGTKLKANIDATKVFGSEFFSQIEDFSKSLKENNTQGVQEALSNLDVHINSVVNERADLGARMNRLDLIKNRVADQEISATKMMSDNEDADMEKVMMNLTTQESIHRAALSAGSRIIQPTLLDFLR